MKNERREYMDLEKTSIKGIIPVSAVIEATKEMVADIEEEDRALIEVETTVIDIIHIEGVIIEGTLLIGGVGVDVVDFCIAISCYIINFILLSITWGSIQALIFVVIVWFIDIVLLG